MKHLERCTHMREGWRRSMNRPTRRIGRQRGTTVRDLAGCVEQPSKHCITDGYPNWAARRTGSSAAAQPRRVPERYGSYRRGVEVLVHLDEERRSIQLRNLHALIDRGQRAGKPYVDDRAVEETQDSMLLRGQVAISPHSAAWHNTLRWIASRPVSIQTGVGALQARRTGAAFC